MAFSKNPDPAAVKSALDHYTEREVGITHPDYPSFVRLTDGGDVEIFAKEGLGIILHPTNNSITFVADNIKFLTNGKNGLRWNDLAFNAQAFQFTEPAFKLYDDTEIQTIYQGVKEILE